MRLKKCVALHFYHVESTVRVRRNFRLRPLIRIVYEECWNKHCEVLGQVTTDQDDDAALTKRFNTLATTFEEKDGASLNMARPLVIL